MESSRKAGEGKERLTNVEEREVDKATGQDRNLGEGAYATEESQDSVCSPHTGDTRECHSLC